MLLNLKTNSTGWVYRLKKDELIQRLTVHGADTTGTVEQLRKRLCGIIRSNINMVDPADPNPKPIPSTSAGSSNMAERNTDRPPTPTNTPKSANLGDVEWLIRQQMHNMGAPVHAEPDANPGIQPHDAAVAPPPGELPGIPPALPPFDAVAADTIRKWNIKFEGGTDAHGFLERLEELADCYQVPRDQIPRMLPEKLHGQALEWYRNYRGNWTSYEDFAADFRKFYLPRQHHDKLEEEIRRRTQGTRENGRDYALHMLTLYRRLGPTPPETQLSRIYGNLRVDVRLQIKRREFTTLAELLDLIDVYENLLKEMPRTPNHLMTPPPAKPRPAPIAEPGSGNLVLARPGNQATAGFNRATSCWRCGQDGHTRYNCPNARIPLCSYCGLRQAKPHLCHCQAGNDQRAPVPE